MRTTLRIDNNLLQELKEIAHKENIPLTRVVNRILRLGMQTQHGALKSSSYREEIYDLGKPYFNLNKALSVSAQLEDEEILRKIENRK